MDSPVSGAGPTAPVFDPDARVLTGTFSLKNHLGGTTRSPTRHAADPSAGRMIAELVPRANAPAGNAFQTITKEVTMAKAFSTSLTRRSVVAGLTLTAAPVAVMAGANNAYA
jgi:hypothetical protein